MGMKENTEMIKKFVNTETGEAKDPVDILSQQCAELEGEVNEINDKLELISRFLKMQSQINNLLKFLVKKKYSEKELDAALEEFEEYEKHLHEEKEKAKNEQNEEKK